MAYIFAQPSAPNAVVSPTISTVLQDIPESIAEDIAEPVAEPVPTSPPAFASSPPALYPAVGLAAAAQWQDPSGDASQGTSCGVE